MIEAAAGSLITILGGVILILVVIECVAIPLGIFNMMRRKLRR